MSQETESIEEMIALLQGYLQQFAQPPMAPLNWSAPKTVKVRGLDVTKKELQELVKSYKTQLSIIARGEENSTSDTRPKFGFVNMGGMTNIGLTNAPQSTTTTPTSSAPTTTPSSTTTTSPARNTTTTTTSPARNTTTTTVVPQNTTSTSSKDPGYTAASVKPKLDSAITAYEKADKALDNATTSNRATLLKRRNDAKTVLDETQKRFDIATQFEETIKLKKTNSLSELRDVAQSRYNALQQATLDYQRDNLNDKKFAAYQTALAKWRAAYDPYIAAGGTPGVEIGKEIAATPAAAGVTPGVPTAVKPGVTPGVTPVESVKPVVTTKTTTTKTPVTQPSMVSPDKIVGQLELRGLPDTPENRKTVRKDLAKKPALSADWKERLIAQYPQYEAYFTDPMFGEDVIAVFQRAMEEEWFKYGDTGQAVFKRELAKTAYGQQSNATQQTFDGKKIADQAKLIETAISDFKQNYGDLGLSTEQMYNIGKETARNGYNDDQKRRALFSMVYAADPGASKDSAIARIDAGKYGQDVNKVYAGNLLITPSDAIRRYTTGEVTLDDIKREASTTAGEIYPGLKTLIQQGVSVKSIADQYAGLAGDILEQPSTTIKMTDPKFRVAMDVRENGTSRVMSVGEWQTMLKSNPDYGWQYTKTANAQALETATMIARAFGKVK